MEVQNLRSEIFHLNSITEQTNHERFRRIAFLIFVQMVGKFAKGKHT